MFEFAGIYANPACEVLFSQVCKKFSEARNRQRTINPYLFNTFKPCSLGHVLSKEHRFNRELDEKLLYSLSDPETGQREGTTVFLHLVERGETPYSHISLHFTHLANVSLMRHALNAYLKGWLEWDQDHFSQFGGLQTPLELFKKKHGGEWLALFSLIEGYNSMDGDKEEHFGLLTESGFPGNKWAYLRDYLRERTLFLTDDDGRYSDAPHVNDLNFVSSLQDKVNCLATKVNGRTDLRPYVGDTFDSMVYLRTDLDAQKFVECVFTTTNNHYAANMYRDRELGMPPRYADWVIEKPFYYFLEWVFCEFFPNFRKHMGKWPKRCVLRTAYKEFLRLDKNWDFHMDPNNHDNKIIEIAEIVCKNLNALGNDK